MRVLPLPITLSLEFAEAGVFADDWLKNEGAETAGVEVCGNAEEPDEVVGLANGLAGRLEGRPNALGCVDDCCPNELLEVGRFCKLLLVGKDEIA